MMRVSPYTLSSMETRSTGGAEEPKDKGSSHPSKRVFSSKVKLNSLASSFVPNVLKDRFVSRAIYVAYFYGEVATSGAVPIDPEPAVDMASYAPHGGCLKLIRHVSKVMMQILQKHEWRYNPDRFRVDELVALRNELLPGASAAATSSSSLAKGGVGGDDGSGPAPSRDLVRLLWAEEITTEIDMRKHDLHGQWLKKKTGRNIDGYDKYGSLRVITVPEASEQRPLVYRGMHVKLRPHLAGWQARVEDVKRRVQIGPFAVNSSIDFIEACEFVRDLQRVAPATLGKILPYIEFNAVVLSRKDDNVTILVPDFSKSCSMLAFCGPAMCRRLISIFRYDVRFGTSLQRRSLGFMRRAILDTRWFVNCIEYPVLSLPTPPLPAMTTTSIVGSSRSWFNTDLNPKQREAIVNFLDLQFPKGQPMIIWAPAGCGKTETVVEILLQLALQQVDARVLLVAPSNAAVDNIVDRIAKSRLVDRTIVRRLNAATRPVGEIRPSSLPFCDIDSAGSCIPIPKDIRRVRIICCTCVFAGYLRSAGVDRTGAFTHLICDEASQAWEPEILVPLSVVGPECRVMLVGDPKQLGPMTRCVKAAKAGLAVSLQERLMRRPEYVQWTDMALSMKKKSLGDDDDDDDASLDQTRRIRLLVQLSRNYRSHAALLRLPALLFYGGTPDVRTLLACGDPRVTDQLLPWNRLTSSECPMLFLDERGGRQGHQPMSSSLFNVKEANRIVQVVTELLTASELRLSSNDIGVIASFRAQVKLIRFKLRAKGYGAIRVGTISDYQGQEESVVLISTVVSDPSLLNARGCRKVGGEEECVPSFSGLLNNPRRFNVAISRAKALLVVVGNASALRRDKYWSIFVDYAEKIGGFRENGFHMPKSRGEGGAKRDENTTAVVALGSGHARSQYPEGLDEWHYAAEDQWRVFL